MVSGGTFSSWPISLFGWAGMGDACAPLSPLYGIALILMEPSCSLTLGAAYFRWHLRGNNLISHC